jgi:hypothetical protein
MNHAGPQIVVGTHLTKHGQRASKSSDGTLLYPHARFSEFTRSLHYQEAARKAEADEGIRTLDPTLVRYEF